ncbi:hypothetical protein RIF29_00625 [Crotalaria pallida]|uniref:Uncharacterized protein n=1 Tax=Crotalaria pallida TaxID=3830 RepID=A0AAN9IWU1_CROPI
MGGSARTHFTGSYGHCVLLMAGQCLCCALVTMNISSRADEEDQGIASTHSSPRPSFDATNGGAVSCHKRARDHATDYEACSKLEDQNLDVRKNSKETEERFLTDNFSQRQEQSTIPLHEVIFSTIDKP